MGAKRTVASHWLWKRRFAVSWRDVSAECFAGRQREPPRRWCCWRWRCVCGGRRNGCRGRCRNGSSAFRCRCVDWPSLPRLWSPRLRRCRRCRRPRRRRRAARALGERPRDLRRRPRLAAAAANVRWHRCRQCHGQRSGGCGGCLHPRALYDDAPGAQSTAHAGRFAGGCRAKSTAAGATAATHATTYLDTTCAAALARAGRGACAWTDEHSDDATAGRLPGDAAWAGAGDGFDVLPLRNRHGRRRLRLGSVGVALCARLARRHVAICCGSSDGGQGARPWILRAVAGDGCRSGNQACAWEWARGGVVSRAASSAGASFAHVPASCA
mmetsp:Transcript_31070/g.103499  ORF Transcript_31070/g.103499 Transcript_31070/m.103499 type:complete len:327 (-) Transcript_31070:265-1245(-)